MILRELKVKMADAGAYMDTIPVVFRTPECSAYYNAECHIAKINNKEHLMIDLVEFSNKGNDFDLDADNCSHPVEGDIQLALDSTIARQNVQIYNNNTYPQIEEIDKIIIERSKQGFDYYEALFCTAFTYTDKSGNNIKLDDLVNRINNHYGNIGFDICVDKIKDMYKVLIQW